MAERTSSSANRAVRVEERLSTMVMGRGGEAAQAAVASK